MESFTTGRPVTRSNLSFPSTRALASDRIPSILCFEKSSDKQLAREAVTGSIAAEERQGVLRGFRALGGENDIASNSRRRG